MHMNDKAFLLYFISTDLIYYIAYYCTRPRSCSIFAFVENVSRHETSISFPLFSLLSLFLSALSVSVFFTYLRDAESM